MIGRTALLLSGLCLVAPVPAAEPDLRIGPAETVQGESQARWAERWWQWAFSFDRSTSPVADRTGAACASRQPDGVWFLAGAYGPQAVRRECTIPQGVTLFFPIINYVVFGPAGPQTDCAQLAERAAANAGDPIALILEINGQSYDDLKAYRQSSRCFSLASDGEPNAVADGYFVALKPLPRGEHVVYFGGALPGNTQDITYRITVE